MYLWSRLVDNTTYYAFSLLNQMNMRNIGQLVYHDTGAEVMPGIYIGSLATATSNETLRAHNIGAIINLSGTQYAPPPGISMYMLNMDDVTVTTASRDKYIRDFSAGVRIIRELRGRQLNVLIHCAAGVNRSATLIGFYLIYLGYTYPELITALGQANARRGTALLTNQSFRDMLQTCASFRQEFPAKK